ncbi:hypothetical protein Gferi_04360 [Geosporobacter ferrireducens]|uniref:Uncharacterized protein n=1 Tax=Geosporobacter ferrireducens TaxID=1424294 RepID=A0A1D8GD70_9FIRM|nr:hypothetical protein Gferi_04360 [Geosporobacter ferrireducens]
MLLIITVNVLFYLLYNAVFCKVGISRKLFINSTFFGTTTGFTFPFVATYYNLKNAIILYFIILCVFLFFLNGQKYAGILVGSSMLILGNTLLDRQESLDAIAIEPNAEAIAMTEVVTGIESFQQEDQAFIEDSEEGEEKELLGEYFDPEISLETSPDLPEEEPSGIVEIQRDLPYYIDKAFEYKTQGRNVEALESFMHILQTSKEVNTRFLSCIHIAAIYKDMDQKQQAQDILYYFIKDNTSAIDLSLLRQAAALLNT